MSWPEVVWWPKVVLNLLALNTARRRYLEPGGTTIIAGHLKDQHNVDISSTQEARTALMQATIIDAFEKAQQTTKLKRRYLTPTASLDLDPAVIEQISVKGLRTVASLSYGQRSRIQGPALLSESRG